MVRGAIVSGGLSFPKIVIFDQNQNPLVGGEGSDCCGGGPLSKIVIFVQNETLLMEGRNMLLCSPPTK